MQQNCFFDVDIIVILKLLVNRLFLCYKIIISGTKIKY